MNPNLRPEKQHTFPNKVNLVRPCRGQGRAESKRKKPDPINQAINKPSNLSQEIPGRTKIETRKINSVHTTSNVVNNNPFIPDVPFHPDPLLRPKHPIKQNVTPEKIHKMYKISITILILILRKTHHFRKASCQRHFKDWTNHSFKIPRN